jgi:hypothetical protein
MAYATVAVRAAGLQKPSGPKKSPAKPTVPTATAESSEVATIRMFLGDMSGHLCGVPDGTTKSTQLASNTAAP